MLATGRRPGQLCSSSRGSAGRPNTQLAALPDHRTKAPVPLSPLQRQRVQQQVEQQQQQRTPAQKAARARSLGLLDSFAKAWLPRLVQQQEEALDTQGKVTQLGERLASEVTAYKARIAAVVQEILATPPPVGSRKLPGAAGDLPPPPLDLLLLERPPHLHHDAAAADAEAAPPEAQLAQLASSIQATNASVREVETLFSSANRTIQGLQAGAAERDQVQDQVADMLLRYADELEAREREQAAAMVAWEREQARVKAEEAAREAEARRQARAEADRRAEQERRARLAAAETARREAEAARVEAEAARVAELDRLAAEASAPKVVKVELGVQLRTKLGQDVVLVGSHPTLGSWDLEAALPLAWSEGHVWRASVEVPADCAQLEYKAVMRRPHGAPPLWEKGGNHTAELAGAKDVTLFHVFKA